MVNSSGLRAGSDKPIVANFSGQVLLRRKDGVKDDHDLVPKPATLHLYVLVRLSLERRPCAVGELVQDLQLNQLQPRRLNK